MRRACNLMFRSITFTARRVASLEESRGQGMRPWQYGCQRRTKFVRHHREKAIFRVGRVIARSVAPTSISVFRKSAFTASTTA
jgi:hypothetical protein